MKRFFFPLFVVFLFSFYLHYFYHSLYPPLPPPESPPLLYSTQYKTDLRLLFLHAIEQAESSIHLVMFGLTEPSILQALAKKAREEELRCSIYYDPTAAHRLRSYPPYFSVYPVVSQGLMHQKILVIDENLVFLGSANMTPTSLQMHDNLVLGMQSQKIAQFLCDRTPQKSGSLKTRVGAQEIELYLLPDPRGLALQAIKRRIAEARHSIKVAMFTLTHAGLVDALIDAQKRGVRVTISIDRNARYGSSHKAIHKLESRGATIVTSRGHPLMHHKFLLVDDRTLVLGSANWTKAAFYKNRDCFVVLPIMTPAQKTTISYLWKQLAQIPSS